jgi:V/A-type H+-transporting ATPase subunit K
VEALGVLGAVLVIALVGVGIYLRTRAKTISKERAKLTMYATMGLNAMFLMAALALAAVAFMNAFPLTAHAAETTGGITQGAGLGYLGAGLSTGIAALGAGIGVGIAGAAGIGAITEKPETLGRTLIYVGLAEGVAIYGLIISIMIMNKL